MSTRYPVRWPVTRTNVSIILHDTVSIVFVDPSFVNKCVLDFKTIEDKLTSIQVEIATLKVKASIWGGIAGLIPVVLGIVLFFSQQG